MFDWLGEALGAIASGGLTGLIGAAVTTWGELANAKELHRHEEAKRDQDIRLAEIESKGDLAVARTEGEAAVGVAEANALAASYGHDKATYATGELTVGQRWLMVLVDFARGMVRPGATLYFTGLATYLTVFAVDLMHRINPDKAAEIALQLVPQIVRVILYLTVAILLWWFGTRQKVFGRAQLKLG